MNLDRRLLREAWAARAALLLTIALGLASAILLVWQAYLISEVLSRVFLGGNGLSDVRHRLLLLALLATGRAGLGWLGHVAAHRVASQVKSEIRERLAAQLLALGPLYATGERTGELITVVTEGIEALEAYLAQYLPQIALAALVPLTFLTFVFPLEPLSAVVMLLTAPVIPLFMVLIGQAARALTLRQWTALGRMSAHFLDRLQGLPTLKILGRSRDQGLAIAEVSDRYRQATMSVLRVAFLSAMALELVATLSTAIVAVQVGLRLLYGRMDFQYAFFVLLLAPEFYLPLRLLGSRFHAGTEGAQAAKRIFEVLESPVCVPGAADYVVTGQSGEAPAPQGVLVPGVVEFQGVAYRYRPDLQPALHGLDLRLDPSSMVGLVGPSGSGKTTIARMLLRFMEPQEGRILADGRPLSSIPAPAWRSCTAWVPQTPTIFRATVWENISLDLKAPGDRSTCGCRDRVMWAAQQAHAHTFIQALPNGYDTVIGEHGARLSGGQIQRIALARAFLRDAPILVLDEATANLDPEHERLIQDAIERLISGRTVLLIAHRVGTVARADRIHVLGGGRIVESGTHLELSHQNGVYRRLLMACAMDGEGQTR